MNTENYIKSNIEFIKENAKGTSLSTPLRSIKGLAQVLKTLYKLTLKQPSNQYVDTSYYTVQCTTKTIYLSTTKSFQSKFSEHDVRHLMRHLALAEIIQPLDWSHLNKDSKLDKMTVVKAKHNESGYTGMTPVYKIANLNETSSIHPERLNRQMTPTISLPYLAIACQYGYELAEQVFANLNNWLVVTPTVNQMRKLATDVRMRKVVMISQLKPYFKPAKMPKNYEQPDSSTYYRRMLASLDVIGWLDAQGLVFGPASKVRDYVKLQDNLNSNSKVLYDKSVIK